MTPNEIRTLIPQVMKEIFLEDAPALIQASIMSFMVDGGNRGGPNKGTLLRIQTGRLARSLKKNTRENIFEVTNEDDTINIEYGSTVEYSAIHEYGGLAGKNHRSNIPARPYIRPGFDKFNEVYLSKIIEKAVNKIVGQLNG